MPAVNRIDTTHIVAQPAALDAVQWPADRLALRIAPDELLLTPPVDNVDRLLAADPHAIAIRDGSFAGVWLPAEVGTALLARTCEWELPPHRPALAQGAVAGLALKIWLTEERFFFVVPVRYAAEFEERMA